MDTTVRIYYPDWNTKACVIQNRELNDNWERVNEYALFSYETCICVYREYEDGSCVLEFNTEGYQHSVTTSKHFRWFVGEFLNYRMENFVKSLMRGCKSTTEFLGTHARLSISADRQTYIQKE